MAPRGAFVLPNVDNDYIVNIIIDSFLARDTPVGGETDAMTR